MTYPDCQVKCADVFEDALKTKVPGEVAILIAEPILAVGGVIVPPPEYWPKVQAFCDKYKVTLIQDEVFAGFGRTGKMFGHQNWDLRPAIVSFAKTIGGGVPLGGFITTEEVGRALEAGDHFTTFGGNNQIGTAAGHAVLDVLEDEKLPERAVRAGKSFIEGLEQLGRWYESIGEVRGRGLLIGVELVRDRASRAPAPDLAKQIQQDLRSQGVLICATGVHNCVLRITPPLLITDNQIGQALAALETALANIYRGKTSGAATPRDV
jgi:4-aminobutyrate aminotransferase-like enzyme